MSDPLERLRNATTARADAGLHRHLYIGTSPLDMSLDLASNDYLGFARHPRITGAAAEAALTWGAGSTGSRLVTGSTGLHLTLELALAKFTGAAAALVFSSGYLANLGAITALAGPGVLIVSDASNHASVIDACRLSRSRVCVTAHRDVAAVENALADRSEEHALVVTDAVFSVDGDLAPLKELHEVVRRHGALLVVDEAHSLGVVGDRGQGAVAVAGLAGERDIVRTVTLSKALGGQGGAVLGAQSVITTLVNTARTFIFDTALAPASAGAALAALALLGEQPHLPEWARQRAIELSEAAAAVGLAASTPAAAVVSVVMGTPGDAMRAKHACQTLGVQVGCFRPPSVPAGGSCLRLTARADLTDDDLALARAALRTAADSRT